MNTRNMTVKQFQKVIGCEYAVASGVLAMLVSLNKVKAIGKAKSPKGQKGKPSTLFSVPDRIEMDFDLSGVVDTELATVEATPEPVAATVETPATPATPVAETVVDSAPAAV